MLVGGAQSTGEYVSNPQKYYGLTSELHCNRVVGCGAWVRGSHFSIPSIDSELMERGKWI